MADVDLDELARLAATWSYSKFTVDIDDLRALIADARIGRAE